MASTIRSLSYLHDVGKEIITGVKKGYDETKNLYSVNIRIENVKPLHVYANYVKYYMFPPKIEFARQLNSSKLRITICDLVLIYHIMIPLRFLLNLILRDDDIVLK